MQDIKTQVREGEIAVTNTGELFRGLSTLTLHPRLQHYEGFPLENDPTGSFSAATPTSEFTLELLWTL